MSGYLHRRYAESLAEFGVPRELPRCGGWILQREIPGTCWRDAMGCYPRFACADWSRLGSDLDDLADELVAVSLVTDPFGDYHPEMLRQYFPDVMVPFKDHFVVDLHQRPESFICRHHQYYARKALRSVSVHQCARPMEFLGEWLALYAALVERHGLKGIPAFSRAAFEKQLNTPGLVMFRAVSQGATVGAQLWYLQGRIGYNHLAATNPLGYELSASYALYQHAVEYFSERGDWLDLGAGAGVGRSRQGIDGLGQFKKGWSTGTRPAYFCGRIFDKKKYHEIIRGDGSPVTDYFPAYRKGEFAV